MLSPIARQRTVLVRRWALAGLIACVALAASAAAAGLAVGYPTRHGHLSANVVLDAVKASAVVLAALAAAVWFTARELPRVHLPAVPLGWLALAVPLAGGWLAAIWTNPFYWAWLWRDRLALLTFLLLAAYALAWPAELLAARTARRTTAHALLTLVAAAYAVAGLVVGLSLPPVAEWGLMVAAGGLGATAALAGLMLVLPARGVAVIFRASGLALVGLSVPTGLWSLLSTRPEEFDEPTLANALLVVGLTVACLSLLVGSRWASLDEVSGTDAAARLLVRCPRCERSERRPVGRSSCSACGLPVSVAVEWPECPSCGYSLRDLAGASCPECGGAVRAAAEGVTAPAAAPPAAGSAGPG